MGLLRRYGLLTVVLAGCFDPAIEGRFSCASDDECPAGLVCAVDGLCRGDRGAADLSSSRSDGAMTHPTTDAAVPPLDLWQPPVVSPPDASMPPSDPPDLATPPSDMAKCMPKKCMKEDCGDLPDGCGGTIHCKDCPR